MSGLGLTVKDGLDWLIGGTPSKWNLRASESLGSVKIEDQDVGLK
jgi:hypothetical protein